MVRSAAPNSLFSLILAHARSLSEGEPLTTEQLSSFGTSLAVNQALARLAKTGHLLRLERGVYVATVDTDTGARAPCHGKVVSALARVRGEKVADHGSVEAFRFGLSATEPDRLMYITSGKSRTLAVGATKVTMRRAPDWQFIHCDQRSGAIIRALAALGETRSRDLAPVIRQLCNPTDVAAIIEEADNLPRWLVRVAIEH